MKRVLLMTLLVLVSAPILGYVAATSSGICFARDRDEGVMTISTSYATVGAQGIGLVKLIVQDKYKDGRYVAAHFVIVVDGYTLVDDWYGVKDGNVTVLKFGFYNAFEYAEAIAEGYYGILDSKADAIAYWSQICPDSCPQIGLTT